MVLENSCVRSGFTVALCFALLFSLVPASVEAQALMYHYSQQQDQIGSPSVRHWKQEVRLLDDITGDYTPEVVSTSHTDMLSLSSASKSRIAAFQSRYGHTVWLREGVQAGNMEGETIAIVSDIDGDGKKDIVLGAPEHNQGMGAVIVRSGADGSVIRTFLGIHPDAHLGSALLAGMDLNRDGKPDMVSCRRGNQGSSVVEGCRADSLVDARHLWSFTYGSTATMAYDVELLSDLTGDGVPEIAIGASDRPSGTNPKSFSIEIRNGATGAIFAHFPHPGGYDLDVKYMAGSSDVDGDGFRNLYVTYSTNYDTYAQALTVGPNGMTLVPGTAPLRIPIFSELREIGDWNLDSIPDIIVNDVNYLNIYHGRNHANLFYTRGSRSFYRRGTYGGFHGTGVSRIGGVDIIGDANGDGLPDLAAVQEVNYQRASGISIFTSGNFTSYPTNCFSDPSDYLTMNTVAAGQTSTITGRITAAPNERIDIGLFFSRDVEEIINLYGNATNGNCFFPDPSIGPSGGLQYIPLHSVTSDSTGSFTTSFSVPNSASIRNLDVYLIAGSVNRGIILDARLIRLP